MDKQLLFVLCVMSESLNLDRIEDRNLTGQLIGYAAKEELDTIPEIEAEDPSIGDAATDFINLNR